MKGASAAGDLNAVWLRHMRRGDFALAWHISDLVLKTARHRPSPHVPRHLQAIWDGTPLDGRRVLVRCYHGLGDTLQFIRFMPLVRARASEVVVWAQGSLLSLLESVDGIDELSALHDGVPDVEYDVDVEIMELPFILRTTLATLPAEVPYLNVTPASRPRDERLAVGLVWKAGDWNPSRSVPFALLKRLASVDGVKLYILQRDAVEAGWEPGFGRYSVAADTLADARQMRSLDLVISVDTMAAHLAGALGVPVWTLLAYEADWRWMEERCDSPWYPTMRLFRQSSPGAWEPVVTAVEQQLREFVNSRAQSFAAA